MIKFMDRREIGGAVMYLARAEEMTGLSGFNVVVADPPYGVAGSSGTINKKNGKAIYAADFEDTRENVRTVIVPAFTAFLKTAGRAAITTGGKNAWLYPEPDAIGGFYQPAGTGMCVWGSVNYQPILYYGRDPRLGLKIIPIARTMNEAAPKLNHPCPKPLVPWQWLVNKCALQGETVLDPFMGTGTTGVCCARLGLKFIGIEFDTSYFEIACRRVEEAYSQSDLFMVQYDR